jgi:hypothetical protein
MPFKYANCRFSLSLTLSLKHWLIVHLFVAIFFDVLGFETWVPFFCGLGSSERSKQASTASGAASKVDYSSTGAIFFSLLHIACTLGMLVSNVFCQ